MAGLAGVGMATVDRVLNERGGASAVTERRVIETARRRWSRRVLPKPHDCLVCPETSFHARLARAFVGVAATLDRSVTPPRGTPENPEAVARRVRAGNPDAPIVHAEEQPKARKAGSAGAGRGWDMSAPMSTAGARSRARGADAQSPGVRGAEARGHVLEAVGISERPPGVRALEDVTLRLRPGVIGTLILGVGAHIQDVVKGLVIVAVTADRRRRAGRCGTRRERARADPFPPGPPAAPGARASGVRTGARGVAPTTGFAPLGRDRGGRPHARDIAARAGSEAPRTGRAARVAPAGGAVAGGDTIGGGAARDAAAREAVA